ncbi:uncharacterized protein C8A04DRAFT_40311 [Dichotomopilus funicola]|uniref:Transmembrane protein n=1 Tax=Dichotomopilus funicola TaxID=1934379 RepID=A0AAN6UXY2_9PEZI|nr:hypothetical protein C8A04DRAFT_40311 [Dichotomopilus funicola]
MDGTLQSLFARFQNNDTWAGKCVDKIYQAAQNGAQEYVLTGLVGQDGVPVAVQNSTSWEMEDIWGISIGLCYTFCSRRAFPMVFNYQVFLSRTTNYLLPWLALTAQLPYEAGDIVPNIMSFFMSLGSPMLLTFSLMMTILNSRWLNRKCKNFECLYSDGPFATRLRSVRIFVEASQQVPIRMSCQGGWLPSLILLETNARWWSRLSTHILATRREVTLSLVAQILVAVVAWVLTIVGSFGSSLGDHAEALVLASSSLWTWLVPVICGWITIGTQNKSDSIESALRADRVGCAPNRSGGLTMEGIQTGFRVAIRDPTDSRNLLGFSVYGDEIQPGPVFNYARIFTWRHTARRLFSYFETAAERFSDQKDLDLAKRISPPLTIQDLDDDIPRMSRYCGIPQGGELTEYPQSAELDAEFWLHVMGAIMVAAFVQWGIAGPAIVIAYLTDVKGLGCRSGSYVLYAVLSTTSFICFFTSILFSRAAMLHAQAQGPPAINGLFRGLSICALVMRLLGRIFAVCGAIWIILSSIWELVGFFDNCWCEGTVLALGDKAWVALFKKAIDLKENATGPWAGGVFMSSFVMGFTYCIFWLFCYNPR